MSFQAQAWAHGQKTGGPSARVVLWSIANYANDDFLAWPKQQRLADDSEQSPDSVGKRISDLIDKGLVRRIKLKRFGRRTHDLFILPPSAYFAAPIEEILPLIPAGCDLLLDQDATASSGSADSEETSADQADSGTDAAADCGSGFDPTLPQSAVHATAPVREPNEPLYEPSTLTQTLSHSNDGKEQPRKEAAAPSEPDLTGLEEFKATYEEPCSNPEMLTHVWAALTHEGRERCLRGARGVRAYRRKNPKARGLVGPLRFARSPAVQDEFAKFAPTDAKPISKVFIENGSEGFRAWCALAVILDLAQPSPKPVPDKGLGIERLTEFPEPGGRALADCVRADGSVDLEQWTIAENNPKSGSSASFHAWADRIKAWTGCRPEPYRIGLGYMTKFEWPIGTFRDVEARTTGLRVPRSFPPHVDGSWSEVETGNLKTG